MIFFYLHRYSIPPILQSFIVVAARVGHLISRILSLPDSPHDATDLLWRLTNTEVLRIKNVAIPIKKKSTAAYLPCLVANN